MKVAVTDYTFPDLAIERGLLEPAGCELVESKDRKPTAELIALVKTADAVITQFASLNAEVIDAMQHAKVIVRYGIGVDNVDLDAARRKGIPVCNVPDYCIDEVADHTLAFILASCRQVVANSNRVKAGQWGLATNLDQMKALRDQTVGIVGFGRIGREVAQRLKPFKCRILVFDPVVVESAVLHAGCVPASWEKILVESNILTLHCPSTAQTRGMIDELAISKMKAGMTLINLARGDLVKPDDLVQGLRTGKIGFAALDVFSPEPIPTDHPILQLENVILASHIASASVPAVKKLRESAARLALAALRGESLPTIVNQVQPKVR